MFEKILFPTDGSDVAQKALQYLIGLRGEGVRHVVLLWVVSDKYTKCICKGFTLVGKQSPKDLEKVRQWLQEEALEKIKPIETELRQAGFEVDLRVETGVPQTKILEIAESEDVSAIVLGSHGRSNVRSALLGSVSEHVIRHSRRPVIVITRG